MKIFNNVLVYQLAAPPKWTDHPQLQDRLEEYASQDPGKSQLERWGFVPPAEGSAEFAPAIHDPVPEKFSRSIALKVRVVERVVPPKAVRKAVADKVREIENAEVRKVWAKEKQQIKDEVLQAMLPNAFLVSSDINLLVAYPYIFIDQTSTRKAEAALQLLREVLGSLPVTQLRTVMPAGSQMTVWASGQHIDHSNLEFGNSFKVEDVSEKGSTLSGSKLNLSGSQSDSDLLSELSQGRAITELGLILSHPEVAFTLTEGLSFKAIRWPSDYASRADEELGDEFTKADVMLVNTALVLSGLRSVVDTVVQALGGFQESNVAKADPVSGEDEDLSDEDDLL